MSIPIFSKCQNRFGRRTRGGCWNISRSSSTNGWTSTIIKDRTRKRRDHGQSSLEDTLAASVQIAPIQRSANTETDQKLGSFLTMGKNFEQRQVFVNGRGWPNVGGKCKKNWTYASRRRGVQRTDIEMHS